MMSDIQQYDTEKYPNFKEYLWYKEHEADLIRRYHGRYIVIKDAQVVGDFGSRRLARQQALAQYKPGTFIIHLCAEKEPRRFPRLYGHRIVTIYEK